VPVRTSLRVANPETEILAKITQVSGFVLTSLTLMLAARERAVTDTAINISCQMVQNLQRKMTQWLLRPLDQFSRVGLGK